MSKFGKPYCRFNITDDKGRSISMLGSEGSQSMRLAAGMKVQMNVVANGKYLNGELPKQSGGNDAARFTGIDDQITQLWVEVQQLKAWREKHVKFHASTRPSDVDLATVVPPIPDEKVDDLPF